MSDNLEKPFKEIFNSTWAEMFDDPIDHPHPTLYGNVCLGRLAVDRHKLEIAWDIKVVHDDRPRKAFEMTVDRFSEGVDYMSPTLAAVGKLAIEINSSHPAAVNRVLGHLGQVARFIFLEKNQQPLIGQAPE